MSNVLQTILAATCIAVASASLIYRSPRSYYIVPRMTQTQVETHESIIHDCCKKCCCLDLGKGLLSKHYLLLKDCE